MLERRAKHVSLNGNAPFLNTLERMSSTHLSRDIMTKSWNVFSYSVGTRKNRK